MVRDGEQFARMTHWLYFQGILSLAHSKYTSFGIYFK